MTERNIKSSPWCWCSKSALGLIRERCEDPASALLVYVALAEIASDNRRETFDSAHSHIAGKCGLSRRTVISRLADLERIGVIAIFKNQNGNFKVPCTYVLLPA